MEIKPDKASLLIVFLKNPVPGKVKTRLAADIGDQNAFLLYLELIRKIQEQLKHLNCAKAVWYSDFIDKADNWDNDQFEKHLQQGKDIGERMMNAFRKSFDLEYKKVMLIGADIIDLSAGLINNGFKLLDSNEVVIGPAKDGGYYLIGMKKNHPLIFSEKDWSTTKVLEQTLETCKMLDLKTAKTAILSDVDDIGDIRQLDQEQLERLSDFLIFRKEK